MKLRRRETNHHHCSIKAVVQEETLPREQKKKRRSSFKLFFCSSLDVMYTYHNCSGAGSAAPRSTKRWVGSTTSTFYSDLISQSEHTTKYVL